MSLLIWLSTLWLQCLIFRGFLHGTDTTFYCYWLYGISWYLPHSSPYSSSPGSLINYTSGHKYDMSSYAHLPYPVASQYVPILVEPRHLPEECSPMILKYWQIWCPTHLHACGAPRWMIYSTSWPPIPSLFFQASIGYHKKASNTVNMILV